MTDLHNGSSAPALLSVKEWAETHRRIAPPARPIPGPGWLDDDTPCACSHYLDSRIADAVLRSDSALLVYVLDAKA